MFKKLILPCLYTLLLVPILLAYLTPKVHAIDGFITITNPNSGTFTEGDTINITWESSSNIDKVNIGYKSCDSCLDWVVFTTPNTGSYSWKVDVGNTTKTDFYLQITGYETGKGSITSNSGHFTVNQNPPLNTTTTTSSTSTSSLPTPTPRVPSNSLPLPYLIPATTPTPTPIPRPIYLSVTTLILYQEFYFEGSRTTDLKKISDPKNVENFTLDTQSGFTFIFQEKLNLTDQKTLSALQNTKDYWEYSEWFIWIEWEWWLKYDITETIKVEYKNDALTAFAPEITTVTKSSPTPTPKASLAPRKAPVVLGAETGKVKLAVNDGTPIKIVPKVELDPPATTTHNSSLTLTGKTSHSNLEWTLTQNGVKSKVVPTLNSDSGEFSIPTSDLIQGANSFALSYNEPGQDTVTLEPITVLYQPNIFALYGRYILYTLAGLTLFLAGFFAPRLIHFKIHKTKSKH